MKAKITVGIVAALLVIGAGAWFYIDYRIRSEVDRRLQEAVDSGSYEALSYDDLAFSFNGDITLTNLHVRQLGAEYTLEQIHVSNMDYQNEFPRQVDVRIQGMQFPNGIPDLSDTENASLGLLISRIAENGAIPLSIAYSHRYDPDNAFQMDSSVNVAIPQLLQLDFSSSMRNLPLESLTEIDQNSADPMVLQSQLMPLLNKTELSLIHIELQDQGLVNAMIEIGASDFNAPPEDYRTMLVGQARNAYLFLPPVAQGLGMDAGIQLAAFLEGGRTLTLKVQPQFNGSVEQLSPQIMGAVFSGDYNRIVELLNLEFTTR